VNSVVHPAYRLAAGVALCGGIICFATHVGQLLGLITKSWGWNPLAPLAAAFCLPVGFLGAWRGRDAPMSKRYSARVQGFKPWAAWLAHSANAYSVLYFIVFVAIRIRSPEGNLDTLWDSGAASFSSAFFFNAFAILTASRTSGD
jgi:hypothetical protein